MQWTPFAYAFTVNAKWNKRDARGRFAAGERRSGSKGKEPKKMDGKLTVKAAEAKIRDWAKLNGLRVVQVEGPEDVLGDEPDGLDYTHLTVRMPSSMRGKPGFDPDFFDASAPYEGEADTTKMDRDFTISLGVDQTTGLVRSYIDDFSDPQVLIDDLGEFSQQRLDQARAARIRAILGPSYVRLQGMSR